MSLNSNNYVGDLKNLKDRIANLCDQIELNDYHFRLRDINVDDFLTTNYDYLIEKSLDENYNHTIGESYSFQLHFLNRRYFD